MPLPLLLGPVIIGATLGAGKAIYDNAKEISEEKKGAVAVRNILTAVKQGNIHYMNIDVGMADENMMNLDMADESNICNGKIISLY